MTVTPVTPNFQFQVRYKIWLYICATVEIFKLSLNFDCYTCVTRFSSPQVLIKFWLYICATGEIFRLSIIFDCYTCVISFSTQKVLVRSDCSIVPQVKFSDLVSFLTVPPVTPAFQLKKCLSGLTVHLCHRWNY